MMKHTLSLTFTKLLFRHALVSVEDGSERPVAALLARGGEGVLALAKVRGHNLV